MAEHIESELARSLLVHLGGVVVHVHLVDVHAHALQDHHHGGLVDGATALFVESIKTFLQRIDLNRQKLFLLFQLSYLIIKPSEMQHSSGDCEFW